MSENPYENWSYDEFIAFVMLYAAHEDGEISDDEADIIKEKIGISTYKKLNHVLQSNINFDNMEIILELKDKFIKNEDDFEQLFKQIDKIIEVDGEVTKFEQDMINSISYLLKNH